MCGEATSPPLRVLFRQYEVWLADLARFPVKLVRQYAAYSVSPCCRPVLYCQPMLPTCVILSAHVADLLCYSVSPCCRPVLYCQPMLPTCVILSANVADLLLLCQPMLPTCVTLSAHVADLCYSVSPCCRPVLLCQPMLPTFCVTLSAHVADFLCYSVSPETDSCYLIPAVRHISLNNKIRFTLFNSYGNFFLTAAEGMSEY